MILLDDKADTLPSGLVGTPFEAVYKALRAVAADVWAVDPTVYRAGMAWGWYALHRSEKLAGFRDVVAAALGSSFAPLVKDTQTDAELVEYLRQWRDYTPTFGRLQALYALFGATVDIQPITDPESQAVLPVADTRLAFYVRITDVDFSRPLSLDDAREIALRATPLGSRPYVYYALESRTQIPVAAIPQAPEVFVENWEIAQPAAPPVPLGDFILVDSSGNVIYSVENLTEIEFTPTGYFTIDEGNEVVFVEQSPGPVVLPEVSVTSENYGCDNVTLSSGSSTGVLKTWGAGAWTGAKMSWDNDNTYSSTTYTPGDGNRYNSCGVFEPVEVTGYVGAKNISNSSQTFRNFYIAICSSNQATVVTVYNASNVAYNAFKFTANNTDYYYVLDGTQTDWTDDLAGIGYHLGGGVVEMDAFFSNRGRSGASDTSVSTSGVYPLYDESGDAITYSAASTYTAENVYNRAGQRPMYGTSVSFVESGGQLAAVFDRYGNVFRISLKIES